jgi:hypothetical protein
LSDFLKLVTRISLANADPALVQLSFDAAVIDRYRGDAAYQVIRTNSAGRVRKQGAWAIDVGIAPDERTVHASWQAIAHALPEAEREHWAAHAAPPSGFSDNFLRMQLSPGSCFDDGDVRTW